MAVVLVTALLAPATASAAELTVTVSPSTVHRNQNYEITISGRYNKHRLHSTPSLLAFIQYTGDPCRSTATAEYQLPTSEWSWVFYPQQRQPNTPFRHVYYKQAQTRFGKRRVCAYLYRRKIMPDSKAKPIATASVRYTEVKK